MDSKLSVVLLLLGTVCFLMEIKEAEAGIKTHHGPGPNRNKLNGSGNQSMGAKEPCVSEGISYASGDTWTDSKGRSCKCFAHGYFVCRDGD